VKSSAPQSYFFAIWWQPVGWWSDTSSPIDVNFTTNWQRVVVTGIAPSGMSYAYLEVASNGGYTIWWDGAQFEQKPYATSWTLGGTTRAQKTLSISPVSSILTPQQGTIDVWVYVPDFWQPGINNWRRIYSIGDAQSPGWFWLGYDPWPGSNNTIALNAYNKNGGVQYAFTPKPSVGWHHFAVRWTTSAVTLFIDGVPKISINNPDLPTNFPSNTLSIGSTSVAPSGSSIADNVSTIIDDLRISNRARTNQEILSLYQSNQPSPVDQWTTLKLNFDGNLNP